MGCPVCLREDGHWTVPHVLGRRPKPRLNPWPYVGLAIVAASGLVFVYLAAAVLGIVAALTGGL